MSDDGLHAEIEILPTSFGAIWLTMTTGTERRRYAGQISPIEAVELATRLKAAAVEAVASSLPARHRTEGERMNAYFEDQAKTIETDYPMPERPYDEPQRTLSHRLQSLEESVEKMGAAIDMMRDEIERIKGCIG